MDQINNLISGGAVTDVLFYVFAALTLLCGVLVIANPFSRNPVTSAMFLVLTIISMAGLFVLLNAFFLAAVQIIVYAGAVMVLFLFVIMLLGEDKPLASEKNAGSQVPLGIVFGLVTVLMLGYLMSNPAKLPARTGNPQQVTTLHSAYATKEEIDAATVPFGSVKAIGNTLFTDYLFAFEATSIVLLVAMVGVVVLAKKRL